MHKRCAEILNELELSGKIIVWRKFKFPQKQPLELRLKDMLEDRPDEKYYIKKEISDKFKFNLKNKEISNSIRVGGKDSTDQKHSWNLVADKDNTEIQQIGNLYNSKNRDNPQRGRVYSTEGIAPACNTCQGGGSGNIPKVIVDDSVKPSVANNIEREKNQIVISNKEIYKMKCKGGFQDNKVGLKVSPTVRATNESNYALDNHFRIRKLTPRECWRLMGWKDEQFDKIKGISNAQLYKMAGNAIVINVLEAIFRQMFLVKYDKKDISISGEQLDLF